ncbi:thioesterase family protein [Nocardioides sp. GY 10113]|uniref:acyl-CoA thioesterase n=1 Tax=Nocardioides sp. GY 10113 TaxID=2569761 RepID=UPI001F10518E|nr:thioesterase family protein [Nocardioides sp. GY 10113]
MVFDCEIQARLRDVNLGGHVDNVEAVRVLDEARLLFFRYVPVPGTDGRPGLLHDLPAQVTMLMGAQRIEYHAEMRFQPFQPFLVRIWVAHVGRTSITVDYELRVAPDQEPAVAAESTLVLWDTTTEAAWPISDEVRATLERYRNDPVALRPRPGA